MTSGQSAHQVLAQIRNRALAKGPTGRQQATDKVVGSWLNTVGHARERLTAIREQQVRAANDLSDDLLTIHTPADIRAELDQLQSSYDIVNQEAKGNPGWDAHYAEFSRYAAQTRPTTEGALGWVRTSAGTLNGIRARAQRLEEWKKALVQQGVRVAEPSKQLPPESGGVFSQVAAAAPWIIGGLVVIEVLRR